MEQIDRQWNERRCVLDEVGQNLRAAVQACAWSKVMEREREGSKNLAGVQRNLEALGFYLGQDRLGLQHIERIVVLRIVENAPEQFLGDVKATCFNGRLTGSKRAGCGTGL